ncbi:uncharacterized protein LOC144657574 isoform X2 [Oculina patagonica]
METDFSPSFLENLTTGEHEIAQSTSPSPGNYPLDSSCDETSLVAMETDFSPSFLENLTTGENEIAQSTSPFAGRYPPDSDGSPAVGCATDGHQFNLDPRVSLSPLLGTGRERPLEQGWHQLTSAHCNGARIMILNPKQEYSKVPIKGGPRGRSEQRILCGKVVMQIETELPLNHLEVYVMREIEAEKKLTTKDANSYGVGPTRITQLDITPANDPGSNPTYICKFDLDSVYTTSDGKKIYKLEKVHGLEYNRFQLKAYLQFVNGTAAVLYPYEFVLTSAKIPGKRSLPLTVNRSSSDVVTSEGGSVSVYGVNLTCPPGALDDSVTIKLTLEEPYKYCGPLVQRGLENDVIFGASVVNCQPNGQKFKENVELTIALDSKKSKSAETAIVLHGTRTSEGKYSWEDITHNSKFDSKKGEIKAEINHFSLIAVLLRLTWVQTKEIVTRLNLMSFKYMLSVLFKSNQQHLPYDELALVFMSQDIYQEQFYREHDDCALMQLKKNGFEELDSNVGEEINYVYNKETLTVSIQLGEDYKPANNQQECITFAVDSSVWWSTGHVIKLPLQGSTGEVKIMCGKIVVKGQHGHVLEDHFCQRDLCGYVRRLLGAENVIFNIKPVTQKLALSEVTLNRVVACWQSEAKQLQMILLRWREKQGNTEDPAALKEALTGLDPEEYRVKERGQMHIGHLRELAVTILGLQHKDPNMLKYLGHESVELCNSVLRDCCIEMATSREDFESATPTTNYASLLVFHRRLSEEVAMKFKQMCCSPLESITESFLTIVAQLVQAVKEIFRDERIPQVQNGLRGVAEETTNIIASDILDAAQAKSILRLVSEVCKILENLCLNNNDNRTTETQIRYWGGCAMIFVMLNFLERFFLSNEARRMYKRLEVFSASLRDIMSNPTAFEGNFLIEFHNVALSLLEFAKFDPSQLVRFELNDPTNSSNTQGSDGLRYDKSQETFSQLFWISKECKDELQLEAVARVHIDGHIHSIGAFESQITLPASCSEAIDRIPIASLSIAVQREQDDSGNLRVTLYATQKKNVRKALNYLKNELGEDVVGLERAEIDQSHLKVRSSANAGTVVRLRLVHKWGSDTLVLESSDFVALADSTAGGACTPDPEIAAEIGKLAIKNELPATVLPIASGSTVGNYSSNFVMDPSDAELVQRHLHEQHGRVEINYHQIFMKGHVCVAGKNTSLNMQEPATGQNFLEAGPSASPHRSITAGSGVDEA